MPDILSLDGVSKNYGAVRVADNICFSVPRGQALGVIGPNGAGKTTMFNLIAGDVAPGQGRIRFAGEDVTDLPLHRRCRKGIVRTFQIPNPFGAMTVFENVLVGATFATGRRERDVYGDCLDILKRIGLANRANRLAGSLTLLERKRLELARALASEPKLLLLDEIAGGLTEAECLDLVDIVNEISASGISVIWIEHIVHALLRVVDRLMVISSGRVIADGKPRDVIADSAVREIYMGVEARA